MKEEALVRFTERPDLFYRKQLYIQVGDIEFDYIEPYPRANSETQFLLDAIQKFATEVGNG